MRMSWLLSLVVILLLIKEGDLFKRIGSIVDVLAGKAMLGSVIDTLGVPIDRKGVLSDHKRRRFKVKERSYARIYLCHGLFFLLCTCVEDKHLESSSFVINLVGSSFPMKFVGCSFVMNLVVSIFVMNSFILFNINLTFNPCKAHIWLT